jgi:hypothetical protein
VQTHELSVELGRARVKQEGREWEVQRLNATIDSLRATQTGGEVRSR